MLIILYNVLYTENVNKNIFPATYNISSAEYGTALLVRFFFPRTLLSYRLKG